MAFKNCHFRWTFIIKNAPANWDLLDTMTFQFWSG